MDPVMSDLDQKIGGCFSESMSSVFSMLTGREFAIKPQDGNTLDHVGVSVLHQATVVYVKAHYTKGMTGTLLFALPLKEGTMLVDLMLGGDGTPSTELAGDSRDALAETFNQIMGSANQALSDLAGETLSISNVEIFSAEGGDSSGLEEIMGPGPFYDLPLETSQESLGTVIHLLIPDLLIQQLKRKLGIGEAPAAPAPAAPEPPGRRRRRGPAPAPPEPRPGPAAVPAAGPQRQASTVETGNLDLLLDIELPLMVRMGQTEMQLGELLKLTPGSILELNRAADAPVELLVNSKLIARGEVVVVDGNFAFRITEIESTDARIRSLV
ncbi:flagellar motor switch protein FliN [Mesoterricola silvestris]|uniref:Flagellar motor switch protein FliN n=1 Tax=Mesoterricola silvestris TaxID=2927979 RepID=A0AA48H025_9BACT|nr:flagellar motor switch protein FliN [Mesoterricola silvestris]BDU73543.1 flagellar motor switch protein FliN [Mesoterricola silvestris]